jgi:hypothetical protein
VALDFLMMKIEYRKTNLKQTISQELKAQTRKIHKLSFIKTRTLYPEYIKGTNNSTVKRQMTQLKKRAQDFSRHFS